MVSRNSMGVVFSIQKVMGLTGSLSAVPGFCFTNLQRWMKSRQGVVSVLVRSVTCVVKYPMRGSSKRGW